MNWIKNNFVFVFIVIAIIIFLLINNFQSRSNANEGENNLPIELTTYEAEEGDITPNEMQVEDVVYVDVKGGVNQPGVYQIEGEKRVRDLIEMAGGFAEDAFPETVNLAQRVFDEMVIYVPVEGNSDNQFIISPIENGKIRINHATIEEISTLAGIGEVKATAIMQYREENGPYKTVEELLNVTGIGEKTLEKIKGQIQIP